MAASSLESFTRACRGILQETGRRSKRPRLNRGYRNPRSSSPCDILHSKVCTFIPWSLLPDLKERGDPPAIDKLQSIGKKMIQVRRSVRIQHENVVEFLAPVRQE